MASSDGNSSEWSAPVRKRMSMKDILGTATRRKWRWDYIPAITITYLRSVRLLDSIMLYLMGGTASRVTRYTRPSQHISCQIFKMPWFTMTIVLSAAYLLSRPSNSYPDTLLSSSASNFVSTACVQGFSGSHRVFQVYVFKEGLTIKRVQIIDRIEIKRVKRQ